MLKLRYTRSSQETKQIQHWPLLLCLFPAVPQADGHQLILEEIPGWNVVELVVNGGFAATSMTWILVSIEFYSSQSLTESTYILKRALPEA